MESIRVSPYQLKPGMITADHVRRENGELLMLVNTILTPRQIIKLQVYRIPEVSVYIPQVMEKEFCEGTITNELFNTYQNPLLKSTKTYYFRKYFSESVYSLFRLNNVLLSKNLSPERAERAVQKTTSRVRKLLSIYEKNGEKEFLKSYNFMPPSPDPVLVHGVNTAVLAYCLGKRLKFEEIHCEYLILAGLLHDFGKLLVYYELLYDPKEYDEEKKARMDKHTELAYEVLKRCNFPDEVFACITDHHKDNSAELSSYVKIIKVCDVYSAMTQSRSYRKHYCPFDAMKMMISDREKYDSLVLNTFIQMMAESFEGASVHLSNSLYGRIASVSADHPYDPIVRIDGDYIDLSKEPDIRIIGCL